MDNFPLALGDSKDSDENGSDAARDAKDVEVVGAYHLLRTEVRLDVIAYCDDVRRCPAGWQIEDWVELVVDRVMLDLLHAVRALLPELILRGEFPSGVYFLNQDVLERLQERARDISPPAGNLFADRIDAELRKPMEGSAED